MMSKLLQPRWILAAILVLLASLVMVCLGFWQLDRLQQRQAFNQHLLNQLQQPALNLNQELPLAQLTSMEYRSLVVSGQYIFGEQFLLRNQAWEDQPGYHLFTPLSITGTPYTLLVNRGWVPLDAASDLSQLDVPGQVTLAGMLRLPLAESEIGGVPDPTLKPGQTRLAAWNYLDFTRLQSQISGTLLPIYLQEKEGRTNLPIPSLPELEITQGSHLGYAIQWFAFAALLIFGFPFYIQKQLSRPQSSEE